MAEVVVVGALTALEGKEEQALEAMRGVRLAYDAVPAGEGAKGSPAAHAGS